MIFRTTLALLFCFLLRQTQGCSDNELLCDTGEKCVLIKNICDDVPDCTDGSDETEDNCPTMPTGTDCGVYQIYCKDDPTNPCYSGYMKCDGVSDCSDNSDEMNCPPATRTLPKRMPKPNMDHNLHRLIRMYYHDLEKIDMTRSNQQKDDLQQRVSFLKRTSFKNPFPDKALVDFLKMKDSEP